LLEHRVKANRGLRIEINLRPPSGGPVLCAPSRGKTENNNCHPRHSYENKQMTPAPSLLQNSFRKFVPLVCLSLALLAMEESATASGLEIPVSANANIRNIDKEDENFLSFTSETTGNRSSWQLIVRASNSPRTESAKIYIEADLRDETSPDRPLTGGKLVLTGVTGTTSQQSHWTQPMTLSLYGIVDNDDEWLESTITWNNAPKNDPLSGHEIEPDGTVLLAEIELAGILHRQPIEFASEELTKYLNWKAGVLPDAYGTGPANHPAATFIIVASDNSPVARFYSRQSVSEETAEFQPKLIIHQAEP